MENFQGLEIFWHGILWGWVFGPGYFLIGSPKKSSGIWFLPPFSHPCHLNSRVRPWLDLGQLGKWGLVYWCNEDRVRTESWILEKDLKFPQQFSRHEKVWKMEINSRKNGKKSWVFFKATTSALKVNFFSFWSNLIQSCPYVYSASWKKLCSCIFKVSFDHLFDNLMSLEK